MVLQHTFRSLRQTALRDTRPWTLQRRCLATPAAGAADTAVLPLAGVKVLDMTRVLAGVRISTSKHEIDTDMLSHTAHRFSVTLGKARPTELFDTSGVRH